MTLPNQLTTLRIALVPIFVWLILSESATGRLWGIAVFIFASLTDLYDGFYARRYGLTSRWGAFMDPLADKILITSAFVYFVHLQLVPLWAVVLIAVRDTLVTVLRWYAERREKPVITSPSAKLKTAAQNIFAYVLLLLTLFRERALFREETAQVAEAILFHDWTYWTMLTLAFYTLYTGGMYLFENWQTLRAAYLSIGSTGKAHQ